MDDCQECASLRLELAAQHEAMEGLVKDFEQVQAERDRLRAILDAPRAALFADGREPTENERHLLNLLSWRQKEAEEAKETLRRALAKPEERG